MMLPSEIWDQIAIYCIDLDIRHVLQTGMQDDCFLSLRQCVSIDKSYVFREALRLYLSSWVFDAHSCDLYRYWRIVGSSCTHYEDPTAILVMKALLSYPFQWDIVQLQDAWQAETEVWISNQIREDNGMRRLFNSLTLGRLESALVRYPEYVNWLNPWSMWVNNDLRLSYYAGESFEAWLIFNGVHELEEDHLMANTDFLRDYLLEEEAVFFRQ